ncbi:MAG: sulfite exporter TauE/SafE family protein [Galactobacter sp.]
MPQPAPRHGGRNIVFFVIIGAIAGFLSGLFGVGGGTVIVPLLTLMLGFAARPAAGASSAAIIVTAAVGVVTYALHGDVDWGAALVIAAGAIVGAQIGVRLLFILHEATLRWIFVGFLVVVAVSLFLVVPSRDAELDWSVLSVLGLLLLGLVTGVLSGLIGVGGGIVVVPALMLLFGVSDLVAKGTSLLMMIPTSLSGTIANFRRKNVDLVAAACIGGAGCLLAPVGTITAHVVDPRLGNILFVCFLVIIGAQMALKAIRAGRKKD